MLRDLLLEGVTSLSRNEWIVARSIWTDVRALGGFEHLCDVTLLGLAVRLGQVQAADRTAAYYQRFAPDDPFLSQVRAEARSVRLRQPDPQSFPLDPEQNDLAGWKTLAAELLEIGSLEAAAMVWTHLSTHAETRLEALRRLLEIEERRGNWHAIEAIAARPDFSRDSNLQQALVRAREFLERRSETCAVHLERFYALPAYALLKRLAYQFSALQPRVRQELQAFESEVGPAASAPALPRAESIDLERAPLVSAPLAVELRARVRPSIAVVIATRDRPELLRRCLRSVVEQTEPPDQVIVVDDGGADDLSAIEAEFATALPLLWMRQDHAGVAAARNRAADSTRATWTCVMDDDDIMLPDRLRDHRESLLDSATAVSHGGWVNFDLEGSETTFLAGKNLNADVFFHAGLALTHGASMIRSDLIKTLRYDENLSAGVDFDFFSRLVRAGERFAHTRSYVLLRRLHHHRIGATSASRTVQVGVRASNIARRIDETGTADRHEEIKKRARLIPMVPIVAVDLHRIEATTGLGFRELRITIKRKVDQNPEVFRAVAMLAPETTVIDDENAESRVILCAPYASCGTDVREDLLAIAATEGRPYNFAVPGNVRRMASLTMRLPKNKNVGLRLQTDGIGALVQVLERSGSLSGAWILNLDTGSSLSEEDAAPFRRREDVAAIEAACRTLPDVRTSLIAL